MEETKSQVIYRLWRRHKLKVWKVLLCTLPVAVFYVFGSVVLAVVMHQHVKSADLSLILACVASPHFLYYVWMKFIREDNEGDEIRMTFWRRSSGIAPLTLQIGALTLRPLCTTTFAAILLWFVSWFQPEGALFICQNILPFIGAVCVQITFWLVVFFGVASCVLKIRKTRRPSKEIEG